MVKKKADIFSLIEKSMAEENVEPWSGSLKDYLNLVVENPELNESSHARIWRMVESSGITFEDEDKNSKNPHFNFFDKDLFGMDRTLQQVMEYFKAAAAGSDVSRRILLLWGPTSSGKSEFASLLKRGLERFSRTSEGAVYCIDGCPMHENPLNAIPEKVRDQIKEQTGLIIKGHLCPKCAYRLENEYNGDFWSFGVRRFFLSEMNRVGIGTFQPGDTKCVAPDTLVMSKNGLEEIQHLGIENEEDVSLDVIDRNHNWNKASKFFRYENREVVNINTNLGYNITCTLNHPLMTVNKSGDFVWKNAEELQNDDCLVMSKGFFKDVENRELPENSMNIKWTPNFAKFLGLYTSKGVMYKPNYHCLEICSKSEEVWNMVKGAMAEIGLEDSCTVRERKSGIIINSKELVSVMKGFGFGTGALIKEIPSIIYTSPHVKEFVLGMWLGDGSAEKHANKNTDEVSYASSSCVLVSQLQTLLLGMGFASSRTAYPDSGISGSHVVKITGQDAVRFADSIGMVRGFSDHEVSNTNISVMPNIDNLVKAANSSVVGMSSWHRHSISDKHNGRRFSNSSLSNYIDDLKSCRCGDSTILGKLEELNSDKYLYVKVASIVPSTSDVYDIEVPNIHEFIANGFVSHNSQSQSELVGSVNFSKLEDYGVESHPLAYNFDGELNVSNRGMMEFIEMLKVDAKFRHILLTLAQEKMIKTERFPLIFADEVVLGHTNETEYNKFLADKKEEALHDRLWVVKFPYNLTLDEEVKIYEKLISNTPGFKDIHIAPHTLKIAAMFAILSRLEDPKSRGISKLQKMQLYNGDEVDGFTKQTVKELTESIDREGLDGISPRYIINRLASCFSQHGVKAVTPVVALRSIMDGLSTNAKLSDEDIGKLKNIASVCIEEYSKIATNEVQKAFFVNFEYEIKNLLSNYIDNVGAYLDDSKVENEWGEMVEPDEALMRSIEEKVEVTSTGKDSFREEVYRKMIRSKSESGGFEYQSHPKLREALEKQLFEERKDVIKLTVSSRNPEPESLKKLNEVVAVLVDQHGYNEESANELLRYVSHVMSKAN